MTNLSVIGKEELNKLTLQYFTNPSYYDGIQSQDPSLEATRRKDIRFYRRRIVAMTKELFREGTESRSLQSAFDGYVNSAIAHLKMLDTKDILQKEYHGLESNNPVSINTQDIGNIVTEANNNMMKTQHVGGTLDTFVTSTKTVENDEIPPKLKMINLHDPELKTKGVKRKKKR